MPARKNIDPKILTKRRPTPTIANMIGKTFERLVVLSYAGYRTLPSGFDYHYVWCMCSCGEKVLGNANHIKHGKWRSCGCLKIDFPNHFKHGYAPLRGKRDKMYVSWQGLHKRCNPNCHSNGKGARKYIEKGIKVCEGWSGENGFENFKKDMFPITDKSLDRIDNDLNYSCGHCSECKRNGWKLNCRWGNDDIQSNNRGDFNNWVEIDGKKLTYTQASRYLGFPHKTLQSRIVNMGWTVDKAISTPILNNKTRKSYKGK